MQLLEDYQLLISFLPTFLIRGGVAILCGALIGIERERRGKPAGFRTNILICLGSTLYMLVSEIILRQAGAGQSDPTRIAAQVVTGIGFLGAGTIIQSRGTITGLTSAATIWVVAAVGLFIGAGFPTMGFLCTILVLITLVGLGRVEPHLLGKCHFVKADIIFSGHDGKSHAEVMSILTEHEIDDKELRVQILKDKTSKMTIMYCDKHPFHQRFLAELWQIPGIVRIERGDASGEA